MKIGGNQKAREFLEAQPDWNKNFPIAEKYKTQAAATLKRKIQIESEGGSGDPVADSLQEQRLQLEPTNFGRSRKLSSSTPDLPDPETPEHVGYYMPDPQTPENVGCFKFQYKCPRPFSCRLKT